MNVLERETILNVKELKSFLNKCAGCQISREKYN